MKRVIFLSILIFISGCATYKPATKPAAFENKQVFDKDYETVWSKTVKFFASKNIPIKTIEKASGLIATDTMMFETVRDKNYFSCDKFMSVGIEVPYQGKASFNVFLEKVSPQKTSVTVNLTANYIVPASQYSAGVERGCFSAGNYEKELLEYLK